MRLMLAACSFLALCTAALPYAEGQILPTAPVKLTQRFADGRVIELTADETYSTVTGEIGVILKIQDPAKPVYMNEDITPKKIDGKWPDAALTEVNVISRSSDGLELGVGTRLQLLRSASGSFVGLIGYPGSRVRLAPGVRVPWKEMELWVDGATPAFFVVGLKEDDAIISEIEAGRTFRFSRKNAKGAVEEGVLMRTPSGVVAKVAGPSIRKRN